MDGSGESQLWDILREDRCGMSPDAEVYQYRQPTKFSSHMARY